MVYIIDRFEGSVAICERMETGERVEIDAKNLPGDAREGDVIRRDGDEYIIDLAQSKQRLADLTARMNRLFKRDL